MPNAARPANTPRPLRLVTPADVQATRETPTSPTCGEPALAIFRLERTTTNQLLPGELTRRVIVHYSDRGNLVLASRRRGGAVLAQAARLGRRALALESTIASDCVSALRPNERADLAVATLNTEASERRASSLAARLLVLLKPGAFLVIALERPRPGLGPIVHACQQSGLQYWQHIIALDPTLAIAGQPGRATGGDEADPERRRALRCHRDLLVFRRPAHADALPSGAAAVEKAAA